jgi:hypothetical protein
MPQSMKNSRMRLFSRTQKMLVGNITFNPVIPISGIQYLVVAGGGGGGENAGGGGGAGGYRSSVPGELSGGSSTVETALSLVRGTSYTVTVGAGGPYQAGLNGANGGDSTFATVTSSGGGGGGYGSYNGQNGGSGGGGGLGGGTTYSYGGTHVANQGYDGQSTINGAGSNYPATYSASGGGGAGGLGQSGSNGNGSNGGVGLQTSITGTATYYAGGGGGGRAGASSGGLGGGGNGASGGYNGTSDSTPGATNSGGGGGGGGGYNNPGLGYTSNFGGKAGGSGIVIIRYPDTYPAATVTGSPTITAITGYRIYTFTASGTITF